MRLMSDEPNIEPRLLIKPFSLIEPKNPENFSLVESLKFENISAALFNDDSSDWSVESVVVPVGKGAGDSGKVNGLSFSSEIPGNMFTGSVCDAWRTGDELTGGTQFP